LVDALANDPVAPPLAAGTVVTTGTLTDALPVASGQHWSTRLDGLRLPGIDLALI
jgi:2-oxo-3-hexenedioate decarboxylase